MRMVGEGEEKGRKYPEMLYRLCMIRRCSPYKIRIRDIRNPRKFLHTLHSISLFRTTITEED
jgi:hypothetical protein